MLPFARLHASTLLRFSVLVQNNNGNITALVQMGSPLYSEVYELLLRPSR